MNLEKGGRGAIERMVEAYGFKTRQALCDHLGISKSTLATRYMRDSFPAEWVIQCALETGTSLKWLTTGQGRNECSQNETTVSLDKHVLADGKLQAEGYYIFDKGLLPTDLVNPLFICDGNRSYVADENFKEIIDGIWLIKFDGKFYIKNVARLPGNKIRIISDNLSFDCGVDEIEFVAQVRLSIY